MKKYILFIILLVPILCHSQNRKVALIHNGQTTLFASNTAIVQAVTAAISGDTLYVPGGYWDATTINKHLTLFGAGHYPDSTQATDASHIVGNFYFSTGSDSSFIQGFDIQGDVIFDTSPDTIDYITINRSRLLTATMNVPTNHITFSENIIMGSINAGNISDFLCIRNNFMLGTTSLGAIIYILQGALIENNIFNHQSPNYFYPKTLHAVNGSLIRNNIFLSALPDFIIYGSNNLFQNNLFTINPTYSTNSTSGNYENVVSTNIFSNYTAIGNFSYTEDYHLQNPTAYLGTDGSQVGIYGGLFPCKKSSVPSNPHIRANNTANTTDVNGNLNVNITVGAQDK